MYWITRLNGLHVLFVIMLILLSIAQICVLIWFIVNMDRDDEEKHNLVKITKMLTKTILAALTIFALAEIFVPTSSDILLMYGVGKPMDNIKLNRPNQKLPDDCAKALDIYLNQQNPKNKRLW